MTNHWQSESNGEISHYQRVPCHYCYRVQAWIEDGLVSKCGHRELMPACHACEHHGEEHERCAGCGR